MNYIKIYELISKYYPIGIDRDELIYDDYQGTKDLKKIVDDFLNNPKKLSQWDSLINKIKAAFPELGKIKERRQPFDVCYSATLLVNRKVIDGFIYEEQLNCHISFLGNYFCLYGKDNIEVNSNNTKIQFDPVITISPINNYEKYFKELRNIVEQVFPTYEFLNHGRLAMNVNGLKIFENLLKRNQFSTVFQALFLPENITDYRTYGDIFYK